jgi:hypothetical protein
MIAQIRLFLANKLQPPVFSERDLIPGTNLPKVLRTPTRDEARMARTFIGESQEQQSAFLEELVQNPQFYTLHEFIDLVFDPCVVGFSFSQITQCLKELNLKLVGFELPVAQEVMLRYRSDYPDDLDMQNTTYMDEFDEKNPGSLKMSTQQISFTCQKL